LNKKIYAIITGTAALISGFICGFIGSGGGMLLLLTLTYLQKKIKDGTGDIKNVYAVNIAAVVAMSAVSAVTYAIAGKLPLRETAVYILPAMAGGLCGAYFLDKIKTSYLNKIFAAVTIYAGVKMLI
jgi:uncharacterized membrane protein YfcA